LVKRKGRQQEGTATLFCPPYTPFFGGSFTVLYAHCNVQRAMVQVGYLTALGIKMSHDGKRHVTAKGELLGKTRPSFLSRRGRVGRAAGLSSTLHSCVYSFFRLFLHHSRFLRSSLPQCSGCRRWLERPGLGRGRSLVHLRITLFANKIEHRTSACQLHPVSNMFNPLTVM